MANNYKINKLLRDSAEKSVIKCIFFTIPPINHFTSYYLIKKYNKIIIHRTVQAMQ